MELSREQVLLKAAFDILKSCDEGPYVKNALEETAIWGGVECDGYYLMNEIQDLLEQQGVVLEGNN